MLAKQPASLGGFEFDAIIKRSETMTCDVPEYATEEGYSITDNICLKPRELEIEAIITNSPVTWAEQHAASSSRVETMVEELRQLWQKKTPVSFTAAGDSYENMCITSITAPRRTKRPQNPAFCVLAQKPLAFSSEVCKWNTTRFPCRIAMIR